MIYLISDLHGDTEKFNKLLKKINIKKEDELIVLGDVISKKENSIKLFNQIYEMDNSTILMGNHEYLAYVYLSSHLEKEKMKDWFDIGGLSVYNEFNELTKKEKNKFLERISSLKLFKSIDINNKSFFLSHSGLNLNSYNNESFIEFLKKMDFQDFLWNREKFYKSKQKFVHNEKEVIFVFGHTPVKYIDKRKTKIWKNKEKDKICIDCGIKNGYLGCLRLNDMKEFYIKKRT